MNADENAKKDLPDEDYNNPDKQHWSIRTKRWRYIRYNNGMEELYDHDRDPNEWTNLAHSPEYADTITELNQQMLSMRSKEGDKRDDWK